MKSGFPLIALLAALSFIGSTSAQMNDVGTFNIAAGIGLGVHGTIYQNTITLGGFTVTDEEEDGAITVTVPIDVQFGIARPVSIGLYLEPGAYLDSNATRTNALFMAGIKPRFYLVQSGDVAWTMDARIGMNFLDINDTDDSLRKLKTKYTGPHFGIGTGVGAYFGGVVGVNVGLTWIRSSFDLKEYTIDEVPQDLDTFQAELETSGVELSIQLAFRF